MIYSSTLLPTLANLDDTIESRKAILDLLSKINANSYPKWGDLSGGNYTEIESDGTLRFNGAATVWRDMISPAINNKPGITSPTWAACVGGIYAYRFDTGSAQEMHGNFEIQHDYKQGTNMDFHIHWSPTTTNTGNVVFGVEYCIRDIGGNFTATTTTTMTPTPAPGVVGQHVLTDIMQIPGGGLTIGAIILYRIYRQNGGTDTFTGNVFLHSIGIHYECDTFGSRKELVK